jgi:nitronate monooxygenase/enoyl-[acyl-carrier protein] reductase II
MHTPFCDLLGVDLPIVLAPFGPWDQVELAVAVCEAGGLGSLGTAIRSPEQLREQWARMRSSTGRPFAINHTGRPFDPDVFDAILEEAPAVISFHIGLPAERVAEAHDAGSLWMQQVGDRRSAEAALEAGADVLVAQGWEAGGNAGWVSTLVLVPQVVDVAGAVTVLAAGGIADGRGIAAALALGAQGAMLGTRFLASEEMTVDASWKRRIVEADAADAVKIPSSERVMPPITLDLPSQPPPAPRALRTELIGRLEADPESVDPADVGPALVAAIRAGGGHDSVPFAGQSAGLVHDVAPAADIVARLVVETETALARASHTLR